MLTQQAIIDFCNQYDYDIRKSGNGRWIDQKLTLDVLSFIADCILQFTEDDPSKEFKVKDIWMYKPVGDIALENRGSGMESLIKTGIALEKANGLDVILMEEPENHLSFTTLRRMLNEISAKQKDSQIIVATHNKPSTKSSNALWSRTHPMLPMMN